MHMVPNSADTNDCLEKETGQEEFCTMKATGIVRRIDDLGRVVIPKEIRRTMRIREGDPLEIYTSKEGEVIFKKYSLMGDIDDLASQFCEALSKNVSGIVAVTDRDTVISIAGGGKRELLEKRISGELEKILEDRRLYLGSAESPVAVTEGNDKYTVYLAAPILSQGDMMGSVLFISDTVDKTAGETERALAETAATFLGRHMEN